MTELELLELLSDVHGGYIRQADAFRQGQLRIVKKKHPMVTALQILSTAAMFVAILGAGYLGLRSQMKRAAQEPDRESMSMATGSEAMDTGTEWQLAVLGDELPFYALENENSVTLSQFCEDLSQAMDTVKVPKPDRYTSLDLDGDGQEELVVEFRGTGDLPRLVLGHFDGELRGSIYYNSQMDEIKEDGTFYYSGSIGIRGWARLQKFGGHWVVEQLDGDYFSLPDTVWTQWVPQDTETEPETTDDTGKVTSESPTREAHGDLTYWKDGAFASVPADLFIGEGFSLYIPREGWVHEVMDYHGTTADRWVCGEETLDEFGLNRMIDTTSREALRKFYDQEYPTRMTVLFRPGTDDQAIRDWIIEVNPQWDITQNARGSLFADTATVNFFPTETGVIVCILETPTFGTEGLGILGAMYQSFSGWSPETAGAQSDVSDREKETSFTLTRYIDSEQRYEEYPVPVQLYRAEGYSTYIPKEGFEKSEGTYGGRPAVRWEYGENRNVWFSVVPLDTTSFNEAIQWGLSAGGPGDTLIEDKSGGICGQSTDGSLFWAITFHEKDFKGIYAVICHYPVAQTDNLAAYVKLMADEFQAE